MKPIRRATGRVRAQTTPVPAWPPKFDVSLWCNACNAVIGTIHGVADHNPGDRVSQAMQGHILERHPVPAVEGTK